MLLLVAALQTAVWSDAPPLPRPVSNNAVAAVADGRRATVYSMLGLGSKAWDGVVNWVFRWQAGSDKWEELAPVPGPGRLAATAQAVRGKIYLFGGYTVAQDGSEKSLPNVDVLDPGRVRWAAAAPMPVPVDDAVSGVWRDSLVFVISGWHDSDNVADVQIFDPAGNTWQVATPIPGPPVFGHAGGIAGNTIVYMGGANTRGDRPRFLIEESAWRGDIDPDDPTMITWRRLPPYPGPALYRAAAVGSGDRVIFAGGTANPYNYNGVGYNGVPSEPEPLAFAYDVRVGRWMRLPALRAATMDHRSLAVAGEYVVLVGGMIGGQRVSDRVQVARLADLR